MQAWTSFSAEAGNVIAGNLIGTDVGGTAALANGSGVDVGAGAHDNTIGGGAGTPVPDSAT